jgi:ABC-type antimicrobial peptide transport system permease subunit
MDLALLGVAIGVAGSLGLTRLLRTQLFGVGERDPVTFVVVAALLSAITLVATLVPALRATKVDPVEALRME